MSGPGGVLSVARADLERAAAGASGTLAVRIYGEADGLATTQMNGGVQFAGALAATARSGFPAPRASFRFVRRLPRPAELHPL